MQLYAYEGGSLRFTRKWKISNLDLIFQQFRKIITTELDFWKTGIATTVAMATIKRQYGRYFGFLENKVG